MTEASYVYFAANSDAIKIGFSTQPYARYFQLLPRVRHLWMIGVVPGSRSDEKAFQDRFDHLRLDLYGEREWFRPAPDLVQFIDLLEANDWLTPWAEYLKQVRQLPPSTQAFPKLEEIIMKQPTADFPRDPEKFRAWADQACKTWPEHLMVLAYNARFDGFDEFERAYAAHAVSGSSV